MTKGKHRATPHGRGSRMLRLAATGCLLAAPGALAPAGSAQADNPTTVAYVLFQLPDLGTVGGGPVTLEPLGTQVHYSLPGGGQIDYTGPTVYMPSVNGGGESCFETADTGWMCTPVVSDGDLTASMSVTTVVDILDAPDDAEPIDIAPDPNAPIPVPDVSPDVTIDQNPPEPTTSDSCSSWGTAIWQNQKAPAGGSSHYYGTLACPPDHWYRGYFYVQNKASSAWPVATYVSKWNEVNGLTVGYGCPSSSHCVKVVDGKYGTYYKDSNGKTQKRWLGLTSYYADEHNRYWGMSIQFNDSWGVKAPVRTEVACHELGHAAGLGHETTNTSCMWYAPDGSQPLPSSDDFNQLYYHTYGPAVRT